MAPTPRAEVAGSAVPSAPTMPRTASTNVVADVVMSRPSRSLSWTAAIVSAAAAVNPLMTGVDRKLTRAPSRARPASTWSAPTSTARAPASARYVDASPSARGATAAAVSSESMATGPTEMNRLVPNTAYTTSDTMAAYRPVIGGTPASAAYAIACGITSTATVAPARRSAARSGRR